MLKQHELGEVFYANRGLDQQKRRDGPSAQLVPLCGRSGSRGYFNGSCAAACRISREMDVVCVATGITCRREVISAQCAGQASPRSAAGRSPELSCMGGGAGRQRGSGLCSKRVVYYRQHLDRRRSGGMDLRRKKETGQKASRAPEREGTQRALIVKFTKNRIRPGFFLPGIESDGNRVERKMLCGSWREQPYLDENEPGSDGRSVGFGGLHNAVYIIFWHKWRKCGICRNSLALLRKIAYSIDVFF